MQPPFFAQSLRTCVAPPQPSFDAEQASHALREARHHHQLPGDCSLAVSKMPEQARDVSSWAERLKTLNKLDGFSQPNSIRRRCVHEAHDCEMAPWALAVGSQCLELAANWSWPKDARRRFKLRSEKLNSEKAVPLSAKS